MLLTVECGSDVCVRESDVCVSDVCESDVCVCERERGSDVCVCERERGELQACKDTKKNPPPSLSTQGRVRAGRADATRSRLLLLQALRLRCQGRVLTL